MELSSLNGSEFITKAIQIGDGELATYNHDNALFFFKNVYVSSLNNASIQSAAVVANELAGKIAGNTCDDRYF
jgi:hypothetical protein